MTELDRRLHDLASELVLDPPDAQPFDELGMVRHLGEPTESVRGGHRRNAARALVAAALVVLVAVAVLAVADRLVTQPADPLPGETCFPDPGRFTGPDGRTFGPIARNNESGVDKSAGWPVVRSEVPDFVRVTCSNGDGVIGWVRSSDLLPQLVGPPVESLALDGGAGTAMCDATGANAGTLQTSPRYPVFADDGATLVGYIYPPIGFLALGEDPHVYPDRNGLRPCDGDFTALPTQPASSRAQLDWLGAVNHDVRYDSYHSMQGLSPEQEMIGYANDYERVKYATYAEQARQFGAQMAKVKGLPYNPADLLAPVRDEAGRIVGYMAGNTGGILTPAQVGDPDFDLCRLQIAANLEQRERFAELPSDERPTIPEGVSSNLTGDPAESVGCKKG